jgi:hypothetical protein
MEEKIHPLVAVGLLVVGSVLVIAFQRPWTHAGGAFLGLGIALLLRQWVLPLEEARRRWVTTIALGGSLLVALVLLVVRLVTTRHSTARVLADTVCYIAFACLVCVVVWMVRRSRRSATQSR